MSDRWDFYFFVVDELPCSTMLDLGVSEQAPIREKPWLVSIRFELQAPRADGLTTDGEASELATHEGELVRALGARCEGQFVGRMTWNGARTLFFYAASPERLEEALVAALGAKFGSEPTRRVTTQVRADPAWRHYLEVLFPGPLELRWIADRHLVDELRDAGDRLDHARSVTHTARFTTDGHARAFARACRDAGFDVEHDEEDGSFVARASRRDLATLVHIHEITSSLLVLAEEHQGVYDGWGCAVERGPDA